SMLPAELFKEQAEKRVVIGLLMNAVIETHELKPAEDKVDMLIEEMAASYEDPDQVREYYLSNPQQRAQIEALALEEQVVEKVLASAEVSQSGSSYEEVIRQANQQA
ncbi:MAG: trigger factor, partial [Oleibacter sp.]|nr:trigger factor [Thalassolituus sp.]